MNARTLETPERAARIGSNFEVETRNDTCPHCGVILVVDNGRCTDCGKGVSLPKAIRRVFDSWPLHRLYKRGSLGDIDEEGKVLYAAGRAYYEHWYASGLSPFGAISFEAIPGSVSPRTRLPATERQQWHREMYRNAERAMGKRVSAFVNAIVLEEEEPESVGRRLTGRTAGNQARASALDILKIGLGHIAEEYGL